MHDPVATPSREGDSVPESGSQELGTAVKEEVVPPIPQPIPVDAIAVAIPPAKPPQFHSCIYVENGGLERKVFRVVAVGLKEAIALVETSVPGAAVLFTSAAPLNAISPSVADVVPQPRPAVSQPQVGP